MICCLAFFIMAFSMGDTLNNAVVEDPANVVSLNKTLSSQSDTLFVSFEDDTIAFQEAVPISNIIYAEHKETPSLFYGIILPIIMLILGVLIDRFAQVFVDRNRIKRNGKRWERELLSFEPIINKQIQELERFIDEYCSKPQRYDIPLLVISQIIKGTIFESLNKEDLFMYLKRKKKHNSDIQDRYNKIMSFIMTLETTYDQLNYSFNSFRESMGSQIEAFNNSQYHYSKHLYDLSSLVPSAMDKVTYQELSKLYNDAFDNHPDVNPLLLEEPFITPSLEILDNHDKQLFKVLTDDLGHIRFSINGMRLEKTYLKSNFENIIETYKTCLGFLNVVQEYFS